MVREPTASEAAAPAKISPAVPAEAPVIAGPGERLIEITSEPEGARVLVNDKPIGRTPLKLAVNVNSHGFCSDYLGLRVRFVAEDPSHVSSSVDLELTPLEKAPIGIFFTPLGGQKKMQ